MAVVEVVVSEETLMRLRLEAGSSDPAVVGLVVSQMVAYALDTDDLPAVPAVPEPHRIGAFVLNDPGAPGGQCEARPRRA